MSDEAKRVSVDEALERNGQTWLPAKGQRVVLRGTGSVVLWSGVATGEAVVISGLVYVGIAHQWGEREDVLMHDLFCVFAA